MKATFAVAVAAASISTASAALGSMALVNQCAYDVYLWSVTSQGSSKMFVLPANSPTIGYKEQYRYIDQYSGVVWKIAPYYFPQNSIPSNKITQLEYTIPKNTGAPGTELLYYDLSWVNGDGWPQTSISMTSSDSSCFSGSCTGAAGEKCTLGYTYDKDDSKTHGCGQESDLVWTLCSNPDQAGLPSTVPRGLVQSTNSYFAKRDVPEKRDADADADADALAVCVGLNGGIAELCDSPAPVVAPSSSPSPSPSTTLATTTPPAPTTTSSAPPTTTPAAIVALQKSSPPQTTTTSTTTPAAAPSSSVPVAAAPVASAVASIVAPIAGIGGSLLKAPLELLQLSNIAKTGVTCWSSAPLGTDCSQGLGSREAAPEPVGHSHARHNHQAFHRRSRIIKSA